MESGWCEVTSFRQCTYPSRSSGAVSSRGSKTVAPSPASNRKGRPRSGAKAFTTRLSQWWLDPARNWPDDQRPLVQECCDLLPVRRHLHGLQRRRHRRLQGFDAPSRLSARPRRHGHLADAIPGLAASRRRLRRLRLLRRRSPLRHARRFCRVHAWREAARHSCADRSRGQPHVRSTPLVQGRAQGSQFEVPRLVRLVKEEAATSGSRHGLSGRAEVDLELRSGSQGLVLPSLLRLPARSQHLAIRRCRPRSSRSWASGFSSGFQASEWMRCRSSSRPKGPNVGKPKEQYDMLRRFREFLQWRQGDCIVLGGSQRAARDRHGIFRRGRRPHAHDVQLSGQPEPVLRARVGRHAPVGQGHEGDQSPTGDGAMGHVPAQSRRARSRPAHRRAAADGVRGVRARARTCSSTTAAFAGGSRRCSTATDGGWSSPTA